jgi:uncharacterized protein (TIGR02284 family)
MTPEETMTAHVEEMKSLHTALIDSRNGYQKALEDAEGRGLTPLFRDMVARRGEDARELETLLRSAGEEPDTDGSFMSTVHRTIMSVRSLFGGIDESILPGLIDGEERIRGYYDDAIKTVPDGSAEHQVLTAQRHELDGIIADMKARTFAAS